MHFLKVESFYLLKVKGTENLACSTRNKVFSYFAEYLLSKFLKHVFLLINTVKNGFPMFPTFSVCYSKIPCVFPVWKKLESNSLCRGHSATAYKSNASPYNSYKYCITFLAKKRQRRLSIL